MKQQNKDNIDISKKDEEKLKLLAMEYIKEKTNEKGLDVSQSFYDYVISKTKSQKLKYCIQRLKEGNKKINKELREESPLTNTADFQFTDTLIPIMLLCKHKEIEQVWNKNERR